MEKRFVVGCTAAIVLTMIGCTWWHEWAIEHAMPTYPVYNESLVAIHRQLEGVDTINEKLDALDVDVNKGRSEATMRALMRR